MVSGLIMDPRIQIVTDTSASEVHCTLYSSFYDFVYFLKFRPFKVNATAYCMLYVILGIMHYQ